MVMVINEYMDSIHTAMQCLPYEKDLKKNVFTSLDYTSDFIFPREFCVNLLYAMLRNAMPLDLPKTYHAVLSQHFVTKVSPPTYHARTR